MADGTIEPGKTEAPAEENAPHPAPVVEIRPPAPGTVPSVVLPDAGEKEGFFARLRNAFKGFFRGLRGLPVEVPPGEEGTIPVVEAEATRRRLLKKLEKTRLLAEKFRDQVTTLKEEAKGGEAAARQLEREIQRSGADAAEAEARLRRELEELRAAVSERDATIEHIRGELASRREEMNRAGASLRSAQQQLEEEKGRAQPREEQQLRELAQLRADMAAREVALAAVRAEHDRAAESAAGEVAALKQAAEQSQSDLEVLRSDLSRRDSELKQIQEESNRQLVSLRSEIEQLSRSRSETEAARAGLAEELAAAQTQLATVEELRRRAVQAEKEAARKAEDAKVLREDVRDKVRRITSLESAVKSADEAQGQRDSLNRELKQRMLQFEAMHSEFGRLQRRVEKLKKVFEEFHAAAISSIQVAGVYADFAVASKDLNDSDRENVTEMKQAIDQLRQAVLKLAAQINEPETPPEP